MKKIVAPSPFIAKQLEIRQLIKILAILIIALGAALIIESFYKTPQKQNSYMDLRLGMTTAEVEYVKGFPDLVSEINLPDPPDNDPFRFFPDYGISVKELKEGQMVEDRGLWLYKLDQNNNTLKVYFDPKAKRINKIGCDAISCPALLGVKLGTREDAILKALGKPNHEEIVGGMKEITYDQLGVWYDLSKMEVYMMGIKETE